MNNCKSTVTIPLRRYEEMKSALDSLKKGEKIIFSRFANPVGLSEIFLKHTEYYVTEDSVVKKFAYRVDDLERRLLEAEIIISAKDALINKIEVVKTQQENTQKSNISAYAINRFLDIISKMSIWEFRHYRKSIKTNRDEMFASLSLLIKG